ncbi:glucose-1-phosphate thymidylyltransferase [Thermobifida alba]|uniref:Glucose-1-phosphate thymidylyltransferase n=1 Tax=Thermobifida alba TaxID=53522 RepID=A0ABY4L5B0_THEAE|nr:glucose-1-phosphate thymidylyltransferase [Thermobifida alba]UPT22071.1 glucose-1-phosphate thymidylyltransferase [Thermobifida alba]
MKALVLSGGLGTRLRPFSHSMPKQLIPVANRPVLEHVLDDVRALGVAEVGLVVGERAEQIEETVGDGSRFGLRVTYLYQEKPLGLAHCVLLARDFLGEDDFVTYLGDNVLPDGVAEIAREFRESRPAAQVVVQKVQDPRAFGVVELGADGTVLRLVEKPEEPRSDLALVGVYFFTPAIHEAVAAVEPSARGELEITDALQWLVDHGRPVRVGEYDGFWRDAGDVEGVLECNRRLLDRMRPAVHGEVDDASVLTGPVVVEHGARVLRSRIEGPAVIGSGSVVEDSGVGRHTSIGRNCVLRGAAVTGSIILDGAELAGVRRLHGSVIGRGASVSAAGAGRRLVVGDHSDVEVEA